MIYNRLAVLRAEAKLSRQQLASRVGVHYQTIGFIERGDYAPSLELAFAIARVFGVPVTHIFADKPFKPVLTHIQGGTDGQENKERATT